MRFYYILRAEMSPGPYSLTELRQMQIHPSDLIKIGNGSWMPASDHPEMSDWFTNGTMAQGFHNEQNINNKKSSSSSTVKKSRTWLIILLILLSITMVCVTIFIIKTSENEVSNTIIPTEELAPENPEIKFDVANHNKKLLDFLKPCNLTGDLKVLIDRCDYFNPATRNTILQIIHSENGGPFNLGQICDIYDHIRSKWKYVNDPVKSEYVASASETLNNGLIGDCDDYAVVLASAILSIGGDSRISYAFGDNGGHAFTEVNIGNSDMTAIENYIKWRYKDDSRINYKLDAIGNKWLNLDWFSEPKRPGGIYFNYSSGQRFFLSEKYCEEITD